MVRRFRVGELPPEGGPLELPAEVRSHIRVLRLEPPTNIVLFDGRGLESPATLLEVGVERAVAEVAPPRAAEVPGGRVVLVVGLPKGSKIDTIVRMATEIGAAQIHLAMTARSVPRGAGRVARLDRVASEAARQSLRADVPEVFPPAPLPEVLGRAPSGAQRWILAPDAATPLGEVDGDEVWVAVGPEGGFSPEELSLAERAHWIPVRLATPVLRVETAAPVAVALAIDRLRGVPRVAKPE